MKESYRPVTDAALPIFQIPSGYRLQGEIEKKGVFDLFTLVILFQFRKSSGIINFKAYTAMINKKNS
jgi:hypothetical protein